MPKLVGTPHREIIRPNDVRQYSIKSKSGSVYDMTLFGGERIIMHYEVQLTFEEKPSKNPIYPDQKIIKRIKYLDPVTDIAQVRHLLNNIIQLDYEAACMILAAYGSKSVEAIINNFTAVKELLKDHPRDIKEIETYRDSDRIRLLQTFFESVGVEYEQKWYNKINNAYGKDLIKEITEKPYVLYDKCCVPIQAVDTVGLHYKFDYAFERVTSLRNWIFHTADNNGILYLTREDISNLCSRYSISINDRVRGLLIDLLYRIVVGETEYFTSPKILKWETFISEYLDKMLDIDPVVPANYSIELLSLVEPKLSPEQQTAVDMAITSNVSIITGPPGTGKSTIIGQICNHLSSHVLVLAPTGTAVQGIVASTRHLTNKPTCMTIHLFLASDVDMTFDTVCIDEMSMVPLHLFKKLLKELDRIANGRPKKSLKDKDYDPPPPPPRLIRNIRLVLCGDKDQLPSIQGGYIFGDLIDYSEIPYIILVKRYRQENEQLITSAQSVLTGQNIEPNEATNIFIAKNKAEIENRMWSILNAESNKITVNNSSILIPLHRKGICTDAFNPMLQNYYNGRSLELITKKGLTIRLGDKLINRKNNYDKQIYNGSILTARELQLDKIVRVSATNMILDRHVNGTRTKRYEVERIGDTTFKAGKEINRNLVCFYHEDETDLERGQVIGFTPKELNHLDLAYATTIHSAQGKGYDFVIIILHSSMYFELLTRKLLYTAITRARKRCFIITDEKALEMCKRIDSRRVTNLYQHWKPSETINYVLQNIYKAIDKVPTKISRILRAYPIQSQFLCLPSTQMELKAGLSDATNLAYEQLATILLTDIKVRSRLYYCIRVNTCRPPVALRVD